MQSRRDILFISKWKELIKLDNRIASQEFYKSIPKIELHRHLEGSLRLSTMLEISDLFQLNLPTKDTQKFKSLVQVVEGEPYNFQNFLSKFSTLRNFYQSPEIIRRITREVIADAAADNIRYLELRFTPVALTRIKNFPLAEAMDWVIDAANAASAEFRIKTFLIASVNRHESVQLAEEVMQLAVDRKDQGIVGMDLAGNEVEFSGEEFEPVFRQAREGGLRITIHAGEWGGPESIKLAINTLYADRIGHGVRVLESSSVIDLAKDKQIAFEVCPTSNYQSGVVSSLHLHPLPKMILNGLRCSINTDDPGISQIDLSREYEIGCEELSISHNNLKKMILDTISQSFMPDVEKKVLHKQIAEELNFF